MNLLDIIDLQSVANARIVEFTAKWNLITKWHISYISLSLVQFRMSHVCRKCMHSEFWLLAGNSKIATSSPISFFCFLQRTICWWSTDEVSSWWRGNSSRCCYCYSHWGRHRITLSRVSAGYAWQPQRFWAWNDRKTKTRIDSWHRLLLIKTKFCHWFWFCDIRSWSWLARTWSGV